ncbi:hypothetical protein FRC00_004698 [Tulasnella sp. 408]|nr:hypothetical protein FRC00_004698 [Tulasnella sp. 408]
MSTDATKTQSPAPADTTAPKRSRKTRPVRRRGRAREDDIEGDDVIERAALTDTDSEPSDQDDTASEDEEEEEPPEPAPQASSSSLASATAATLPTPVTESTPPPVKAGEETSAPATQKEPTQLWSDAVAEDKPGNGEDLPVIDFAELSAVPQGESITSLLDKKKRKKKKKTKADQSSTPKAPAQETKPGGPSTSASGGPSAAPAPAPADTAAPTEPSTSATAAPAPDSASTPVPSSSKPPKHIPAYITARQSYLKKLSSDPAATPRVGQFWGHDDRLMDKELRPMSDWWRGRGTQETPANQPTHPSSAPRQGTHPTAPPGQVAAGQHKRTETLERAILKDSFTKAASSTGASDAVASPSTSQPPVNVNGPLVTHPSGNPGYSYVALPPGLAMGESGLLYEIATGRPVVLNPQAAAPATSTPPLPLPPMSASGPVYNPRPVPHPHVARSGSMSYIPPHVLNSLGASSGTPDSYPATPPTYPGYPGSPVGEQRNGTPTFFAPPKPRGRLSIRAPDSTTSETGAQDSTKSQPQQGQHQQQAQPQQAQPQPQTTVVPQSTYAPQPQYPASTTHISEAAHAASYAPPPDQYYNNGYYGAPSANGNGYPGVPTVIGGQTYYSPAYYPQPYGYGPGAEYGYAPPADESYGAYGRQQMPGYCVASQVD